MLSFYGNHSNFVQVLNTKRRAREHQFNFKGLWCRPIGLQKTISVPEMGRQIYSVSKKIMSKHLVAKIISDALQSENIYFDSDKNP